MLERLYKSDSDLLLLVIVFYICIVILGTITTLILLLQLMFTLFLSSKSWKYFSLKRREWNGSSYRNNSDSEMQSEKRMSSRETLQMSKEVRPVYTEGRRTNDSRQKISYSRIKGHIIHLAQPQQTFVSEKLD